MPRPYRKNARTTPFIEGAADYKIRDGVDFAATINAKDFPATGPKGTFRVYRVYGDVTRPERLKNAISNLLAERGVERRVEVNL